MYVAIYCHLASYYVTIMEITVSTYNEHTAHVHKAVTCLPTGIKSHLSMYVSTYLATYVRS